MMRCELGCCSLSQAALECLYRVSKHCKVNGIETINWNEADIQLFFTLVGLVCHSNLSYCRFTTLKLVLLFGQIQFCHIFLPVGMPLSILQKEIVENKWFWKQICIILNFSWICPLFCVGMYVPVCLVDALEFLSLILDWHLWGSVGVFLYLIFVVYLPLEENSS